MVWDRANPVLNKHKIDPGLYPAVVQFLGAGYENLLPGFEIGGGFSGNRGDLGSRSHKDFLLAVLVLQGQHGTVHAGDLVVDRGVGHRAVGLKIPGLVTLGEAALGLREDVEGHGLLAAVLRHPGHRNV